MSRNRVRICAKWTKWAIWIIWWGCFSGQFSPAADTNSLLILPNSSPSYPSSAATQVGQEYLPVLPAAETRRQDGQIAARRAGQPIRTAQSGQPAGVPQDSRLPHPAGPVPSFVNVSQRVTPQGSSQSPPAGLVDQQAVQTRSNSSAVPASSAQELAAAYAKHLAAQKERLTEELSKYPPPLAPLSRAVFDRLDQAAALCQKWQQTASELQQIQVQQAQLRQQMERTQQKVEAVGQAHSIGLLLRKQLATLPDPRHIQSQLRTRQPEIQALTLELFQVQDRQAELKDLESQVQKQLAQLGPPPSGISPEAWQQAIGQLLQVEQVQVDWLLAIVQRYFETLVELDQSQAELLRLVEEYRQYIQERILWIRSTPVLGLEAIRHGLGAAGWLVRTEHLRPLAAEVWESVQKYPLPLLAFLALAALGRWSTQKFRQKLPQIGLQAQQETYCRFLPTLQTALMTVLVGMFWPAVLWLLPWALGWLLSPMELLRAIGAALQLLAWTLLPWQVLLASCVDHGLVEAHFGWPRESVRVLRRWLRGVGVMGLPLLLLAAVFHYQSEERLDSSLGRLGFIGLMLVWAVGWAWLLRSKGPFVQAWAAHQASPWWLRFRLAAYWLGVLGPVGLAGLAGTGYYYTAQELAWRCYGSLVILVGVGWVGAILRRGILILRRRSTMRRQAAAAAVLGEAGLAPSGESAPSAMPTAPGPPEPLPPSPAEKVAPLPDLGQMSLQVERLLGVLLGLGAIGLLGLVWMDILPALAMLKQVPLWTTSWQVVPEPGGGETTAAPTLAARWVTAADLVWAMLVLLITYLGAKNLPALLELILPEKLPIDQGARYALKTLVQYTVVLIGLLLGLPPLGITWNRLQWLVAALGVGLGFGLQEIFANFISGLILLFERPIRVGDIVTIGDVTGVVSKIHIRATIITNWDRQDLIVPNKEFITSRVLNWTLTNLTNRIVLQVGVAYGSDPDRVRRLLEEILLAHPLVLREPAPLVTLENLGDSALQFTIRAYLPTLDKRLQTIHELYTAIHNRFRQEGIEIPFPQRELHIRSWTAPAGEVSA